MKKIIINSKTKIITRARAESTESCAVSQKCVRTKMDCLGAGGGSGGGTCIIVCVVNNVRSSVASML